MDEAERPSFLQSLGFEKSAQDSQVVINYAAFLSHHKAHGGDAARIFVDTARRIVYENAESAKHLKELFQAAYKETQAKADLSNIQSQPLPPHRMSSEMSASLIEASLRRGQMPDENSFSRKNAFLPSGGDRSSMDAETGMSAFQKARRKIARDLAPKDFIFLDSTKCATFAR
jgi:hypothetical protein